MASESASKLLMHSFSKARVCRISANASKLATASRRGVHQNSRAVAITASSARLRPKLQPLHQPVFLSHPIAATGSRTIFIQTENTPNADVSEDGLWMMMLHLCSRTSGTEILTQPSGTASGFVVALLGIPFPAINLGSTASLTSGGTTPQYRWNHLCVLRARLHHRH